MSTKTSPAKNSEESQRESQIKAPSITLPKGGGAIRGIGEKFAANPVTGTGSLSIPIATSPARSGFGPQLSLTYDSGSGNGPFGFGWNLSLPAITRKTDKGLPQYGDAEESDVFLLSGAEDLVPVFEDGTRFEDNSTVPDYTIHRYQPRIEGLFARIERWTRQSDGDVHWRSISKDNILTLYGKDADSRIADPKDSGRIFSWLICETRYDKGNAVLYEYKPEDGAGINLTSPHERNRGGGDDPLRTANRYLKHIRYGNRISLLNNDGQRPRSLTEVQVQNAGWMFEVVLDYGEHDANVPKPDDPDQWDFRDDPFSTYRAGFEVRTTRLCQRVLMFHHFPDEDGIGNDCLVRSTDFTYSHEQDPANVRNPVYTFLRAVTQIGYKREGDGYLKGNLPPVEFEYTQPVVQDTVEEVDPESLENLPMGVDGSSYQWTDLHGEGIPGILTEQADAWFYKRNLSPIGKHPVEFAPLECVAAKPNLALATGAQFMDLAGDGQPDLVVLDDPTPGLYEHDGEEGWQPFRPFTSRLNRDAQDPNLKFVDLDGDGHADVFISEDDAFIWHRSLAEEGFGPAHRVAKALNEEKGPRLVFADGTQSIYLADFSGDGLTDLVRIRNGEVCYWPNLGYGRFGSKISMDHTPNFDHPDQFDHKRIRLADIDGTGTTDIIYLHRDGVCLYFNQSGNGWSKTQILNVFPRVDDLVSLAPTDLLGNGTACLVWSSPLPGDSGQPMRYVNLMGGQKPHLLIKTINNLGAETRVQYAPSTKFYLQDKLAGTPWITRLPFPVHVVERVETYDHISRNRFVTRYAYHHGYFDGVEREFRGFGMVEQWDTEEYATLSATGELEDSTAATNIEPASHVPPVLTKTWFHTGAYVLGDKISLQYMHEYYGVPNRDDVDYEASLLAFEKTLLPDTILPDNLTAEEAREACRALKGSVLRREIYGLDDSDQNPHPYSVAESNFTVQCLQPEGDNRNGVFFTHPREVVTYNYERNPDDPRIGHQLILEVDPHGNVLKSAAIGYGRNPANVILTEEDDREKQTTTHITYTENGFTNGIDDSITNPDGSVKYPDEYRTPLPSETRTYELIGYTISSENNRYGHGDFITQVEDTLVLDFDSEILYHQKPSGGKQRRLIEHVRTFYRADDLSGSLALGELESLALPHESHKLALTPELVTQIYRRTHDGEEENLLVDPDRVIGEIGGYVHSEGDSNWWIRSGKVYYSPDAAHDPVAELAYAEVHFFLPHRFEDPFGNSTVITYDTATDGREYNLLVTSITDPLENQTRAEHDYRVLQPRLIIDPNHNHSEVIFDTLGMVAGAAVKGKVDEEGRSESGDSLDGFVSDLTSEQLQPFVETPGTESADLLGNATTRIVYDLDSYVNTGQPAYAATIARENHVNDDSNPQSRPQVSFSYSDGFGREIQKKIQAEPGPLDLNDPESPHADPRWVGSGWTIFNNKGKPVRQYEPFFSPAHGFEFARIEGVSPILFYDPVGRVVATLHPNHSWEKVVFDPWRQETWDVSDTILVDDPDLDDPGNDEDVGGFFRRLPEADYLPTWYDLRTDPAKALEEWPDLDEHGRPLPDNEKRRASEEKAAEKSAVHTDTPTTAHLDTLGRPFLTVALNKFERKNRDDGTSEIIEEPPYHTRVELDIEGNQRDVIDAKDRIVMRYDYDMLGTRIHQISMEAGERWMLNDVAGKSIQAWDSRRHNFRTEYDALRRPVRAFVQGAVQDEPPDGILYQRIEYGEGQSDDVALNLRTRVYCQYDGAGVVTSMGTNPETDRLEAYDFKGNLLRSSRQLTADYKTPPDWSADPELEEEIFTSSTVYDALNRPVALTTPDNSVTRPSYNEANLLEGIEANLHGSDSATTFIKNIDYDAKGQRTLIEYGSGAAPDSQGVTTTYTYDPLTFRLIHLLTRRDATAFPGDCPDPRPTGWPGCQIQNLYYTYDPTGNITHIRDDAQQTIFFRNRCVEPIAEYTYDALYRLIEATGREHLGQNASGGLNQPVMPDHTDAPRVRLDHPGDCNALGNYTQWYDYDSVGNILAMRHQTGGGGWTRCYQYVNDSNRLLSTGGHNDPHAPCPTPYADEPVYLEQYTYDAHGSMTTMPHLSFMSWDFKDQLQASTRQVVNNSGTPEITYYVYDAAGQRVRKVTERQAGPGETPRKKNERIYLGGFEIYREYRGDGERRELERETLHVMDDQQRIALVKTKTFDDGIEVSSPDSVIRFQLNNHLGSSSLELDEGARVISYEEYYPYGSTSYQAVRGAVEVSAKRYRYTGMERDEETGLNYHTARYYAPWLGRWISTDPNTESSFNLFVALNDNPIIHVDTNGENWRHFVGGYLEGRQERFRQVVRGLNPFNNPLLSIIQRTVSPEEVRQAWPFLRFWENIEAAQAARESGDDETADRLMGHALADLQETAEDIAMFVAMFGGAQVAHGHRLEVLVDLYVRLPGQPDPRAHLPVPGQLGPRARLPVPGRPGPQARLREHRLARA